MGRGLFRVRMLLPDRNRWAQDMLRWLWLAGPVCGWTPITFCWTPMPGTTPDIRPATTTSRIRRGAIADWRARPTIDCQRGGPLARERGGMNFQPRIITRALCIRRLAAARIIFARAASARVAGGRFRRASESTM